MKEAFFEKFGQIFCRDYENFSVFLKQSNFFKEVKSKKYNNTDFKYYESTEKYNGLSYILQLTNTPFSQLLSVFSCKSNYFNNKNDKSPSLNRLFSLDLKVLNIYELMGKNPDIMNILADLGDEPSDNVPNVLSVGDIDGLKQFFIDAQYELGINNFDKLIKDYSQYDEEFLFKLDFIFNLYHHKGFTEKMILGGSYHYIKCHVENKEVFSYSNDSSEDYFFIFERDIETKNIRVFFDFMSNIDKSKFKFSTCVVGNHPMIVRHYLENEIPCFISTDGHTKVIKNTQTYLFDDIEYIANNLAQKLNIKLPKIFSIY